MSDYKIERKLFSYKVNINGNVEEFDLLDLIADLVGWVKNHDSVVSDINAPQNSIEYKIARFEQVHTFWTNNKGGM